MQAIKSEQCVNGKIRGCTLTGEDMFLHRKAR